jgi:hypothetical protein
MWAVCRSRRRLLLYGALLIFIPVGLLEALDDELQKPLEDPDVLNAIDVVEIVLAGIVHTGGALGGEVLYAGIVAGAIAAERLGVERPLGELVRALPFWRLVAIDLLLAVTVGLGLFVLIVPGIIALVWFCLAPPVVKIEHLSLLAAFRRSRELVRGHFWLVFWLVIPVLLIGDALTTVAGSGAISAFGETFIGHWVAATAVNLATAPLYGLASVVLYYELRDSPPAAVAS